MNRRKWIPWIKTAAAFLIMALHIAPFYILINMSLKSPQERTSKWLPPMEPFFDNYVNAVTVGNLFKAIGNTLFIVVCSVVIIVVTGAMAAYPLARKGTKKNKIILAFIVGVMMVPQLSVLVPLYKELVAMGGINH